MSICKGHWFYVPYELRVLLWEARETEHMHSDDAIAHAEIAIQKWIERYTGRDLTSKNCDVTSSLQSAVNHRGESMSLTPKLLAGALMAAANVLLATDGVANPATPAETPAPAPAKGRGRPPKAAPTPASDDLDGDDLGGNPAASGGDGLDDDLGDGLDDDAPATPPAPTEEDLRKKLIELKNLDGDNTRVQAVCKRFTGDKAPLAKNVPAEQYAAAIELAQKQIAKGKPAKK